MRHAKGTIISDQTLVEFYEQLLLAANVDEPEANIIASVLAWFDLIGRPLHSAVRLPIYLKRFELGLMKSPCRPAFTKKSETLMAIDGHDGFGQYLGHIAMQKAISMADETGVGVVAVKRSNHFGAGAYYVQLAAKQQKLGLSMSNVVPKVAPHGGTTPVLGTNPFAFAAPTRSEQSILVDFSTGASAGSKVRQAAERGEPLPTGAFVDEEGQPVTDARQVEQGAGTMLPFGAAKGFCLGLMVEILSGVITGAAISHEIASVYKDFERSSNLGQLFIAIDIDKLIPLTQYYERMDTLIGFVKQAKPQPGFDEVLLPGETRWRNYQRYQQDGVPLSEEAISQLTHLAQKFSVPVPW